ncbi:ABC transporter substrate-binding protein [Methyloraptor flagellatus]|jgi:polar amino acid transport system substrate-binding protein|uniref:ABC transporter substrate-binding protein n=1 Tax=Methyloraptor flagellatus TaxID=3162530 RepID=A0AAU7XDM3_9HYPH
MLLRSTLLRRFALVVGLAAAVPAQAAEVLKVGSTPTGIPFTFLDTKTNTIQGVMVDIINEVGKETGYTIQIEPMAFSALIPSLTSNKIDVISAAMFATEKRKEIMDFTDTVYGYGEAMVVAKSDTKAYKELADLKGETVGAQVGTAFVDPLKNAGVFAEVKVYDTGPDMMRDVMNGRIKATFIDYPVIAYQMGQGQFPTLRIVTDYKPLVNGQIGIGLRKGDDKLPKFNAAIAKIKADGRLAAIIKKWGL